MSLTTNHGIHMNLALIAPPGALLLVAAFIPAVPGPNDRVIQSGETLVYDTGNGPLVLDSLEIQAGGILRVQGPLAFRLHARRSIQIDGTLDMTAFDGPPVFTLNTPNQPELGGPGGPGGGRGGTGSWQTSSVTPFGLDGGDGLGALAGGGGGGESGWSYDSSSNGVHRRPGGGGGGVFGPAELVVPNALDPANQGRVALSGRNGDAQAMGAVSSQPPPQGGGTGSPVFTDAAIDNNFFGRKALSGGGVIVGELSAPQAGQGGGAGGDATHLNAGQLYPPPTLIYVNQDKGAGGGGGGGLGILISRRIVVGAQGEILCDGGAGGGGENTAGVNRIGGGGGGGSGGMLVLQAEKINLAQATGVPLSALGGVGGQGANNILLADCGGGHGGPGLIQLHVPDGDPAHVLLPPGRNLGDLSAPRAHVLMLESSL